MPRTKNKKRQKCRYIYIVTRLMYEQGWGLAIPNLGVHTSLKSAEKHFHDVKKDRIERNKANCHWDRYWDCYRQEPYSRIDYRSTYLEYEECNKKVVEKLKIERWEI